MLLTYTYPAHRIPRDLLCLNLRAIRRRRNAGSFIHPSLFFVLSTLILGAMVVGGLFGVVVTLGRGIFLQEPPHHGVLTLQITPASVALGATISLRGSNFSPGGRVGLTRDSTIPIMDTGGQDVIAANAAGTFTDTIIVTADWHAGAHVIQAEDATQHKTAAFNLQVSGSSASLRPAHLLLSTLSANFVQTTRRQPARR